MPDTSQWFTETSDATGSGFALRVRRKLHEEQSQYQKIEIYETTDWGNLMVIDDCIMLTTRDNFLYHEMMSHPVLFAHPEPKRVVIIGGGDCGTLREVLKHPGVERVTQIDIDERVTRLSETYFPELCESNDDPRAELLFIDGIEWMQQAEADSIDVIIVDSTDPVGPGEVLFSEAFYKACRNALRPDGLIVQQSESPLLHRELLKRIYHDMQSAGFAAIRTLQFPQPVYPGGWWSATMATTLSTWPEPRYSAMEEIKGMRYFNRAIFDASFALPSFVTED
ncbi:MAG: polyamine aminopropyltransferase [Sedimenticolaceae bacterium]|nr:polyamine aminopropyltransferase [Sedimenticolaceae bacterium]